MLRYIRSLSDKDLALDRIDDPARLVHDEAQRHQRDDPDHLAGVRARCTRSRRPTSCAGYARARRAAARLAVRRPPAMPASACSPTPARKANTPACWRSRPGTSRAATGHRNICLIPESAHGTNPASGADGRHAGGGGEVRRDGQRRPRRPARQVRAAQRRPRRVMITYPSHLRRVRAAREGAVRARAPARRPRVRRRRQHERAGRRGRAGRVRRRRQPPEPAQDLLHPARRRRPRRRAGVRGRGPRALPARAPRPAAGREQPVGAVSAAPLGNAGVLPISLDVLPHDGRRRPERTPPRPRSSSPTTSAARLADHYDIHYSGNVAGIKGGGVAHECILDLRPLKDTQRRQRRGRRQAPDRLRLPRADAELPGRRHADGRAHRERAAGRARPLLRRDDRHPRGDPRASSAATGRSDDNPLKHAPHTAGVAAEGRLAACLHARAGRLSARRRCSARSTGRRWAASTTSTATATCSAAACRCRPTNDGPHAHCVRCAPGGRSRLGAARRRLTPSTSLWHQRTMPIP